MRLLRYLLVAVESLAVHKLRAALTALGIIIGVTAVLVTVGIGRGAASNITERIQSQGTNLLMVMPGASRSGALRQGVGSARTLTIGDAQALANSGFQPAPRLVVATYSGMARLVFGNANNQYQVVGTTAGYAAARNLELNSGRFLSPDEVREQRQVVVIGGTIASELFGSRDPLGQSVRINGQPFDVIGVLKTSGGFGFNRTDTQAFVPLQVAQGRLLNAPRYRGEMVVSDITVVATSADEMDALQRQIEIILRLRHNLKADAANDFSIVNQASLLEVASSVSRTLSLFLGAIGAISLLVGGIGIMNIMLVSVTERTREIGLRKALGARDSDILLQFLVEALTLCALGGLLGVALAYGATFAFSYIPNVNFRVTIQPDSVALALGVSLLSGVLFGLYPAVRATRLDPIEALRYE